MVMGSSWALYQLSGKHPRYSYQFTSCVSAFKWTLSNFEWWSPWMIAVPDVIRSRSLSSCTWDMALNIMVANWYRFVWNEESLFCFVHRCNDCEPPWLLRETDQFRRENRREQEQLAESNLPRPSEDSWSGAGLESSVRSTNPRAIRISADVWWRNPQHVWGDSLLQNWWVSALQLTLLKTWNENVKYTRNRLHSRH